MFLIMNMFEFLKLNSPKVMLCAAGIGVTPYASLLRQIKHRKDTGQKMKIKKCWFYWINRDTGSFGWFSDFLAEAESLYPNFFEFHTFLTGSIEADKIRKIFEKSEECNQKRKSLIRVFV
jgi:NADPH oxidase 2